MMLVKVQVAPSKHGLGIFAIEKIPKGTPVWRYHAGWDLTFTKHEWLLLEEQTRANIQHYIYQSKTGKFVYCIDDARFFNHSNQPNTGPIPDVVNGYYEIAFKDIAAGEELTCDYRNYEDTDWFNARGIC